MKSGEPPITRRAAHNSGSGNKPIRRVVIHATCPGVGFPAASKKGTASGTAKYFQMQSSGGSAHYIYDSSRHEEHCVPENTIAWHAPPNSHTIGIEICGEASYSRSQWLSDQVWPAVEEAAARTRELCQRYDLPMRKLTVAQVKANAEGVCGHIDVSRAFGQTDHTDPGPNFPWNEFMALVAGEEEDDVDVNDVWHKATIKMNKGEASESERSPASFLQELETEQDRIKKRQDDQAAVLKDVSAKLDAILAKLNG